MNTPQKGDSLTECIAPPALSDKQLQAALDGDADAKLQAHLERCAFCSGRLESLRIAEQLWFTTMHRAGCPPADQLADYAMGTLLPYNHTAVEQHLQQCVLCQKEVANLRAIFVLNEPEGGERLRASVGQQVRGFFHSMEEQLVRVLTLQPSTAYGQLKGKSGSHNRLLSYTNGTVSVMLSLEKVVDKVKINGSILDTAEQGQWHAGSVELVNLAEGQGRYLAVIDEDEMFTFDSVAPGRFRLSIYTVNGQILRLEDIELKV